MKDDYHRVFTQIDGEEKPIFLSKSDLSNGLQESWLHDDENLWKLIKEQLPGIVKTAIRDHEDEQAEALAKARAEYLEKHPPPTRNPIKAFVADNWGWFIAIGIGGAILRPDLAMDFLRMFFRV